MNKQLHDVLKLGWTRFCVDIFRCNKKFSCPQGKELLKFIVMIPQVVDLIGKLFETSQYLDSFCDGLLLWSEISEFMNITKVIIPHDAPDLIRLKKIDYAIKMERFENNVSRLYKCGSTSFLTSGTSYVGDLETFYFHTARYYLTCISRETWDMFGLGLVVYSMQGVERRNKESKCAMNNSNNKGNIVVHNLSFLWDVFDHGFHYVEE